MWSKCCCRRGTTNSRQEINPFKRTQSTEEEKEPGAYLTIFMYYVQVPALLKISILYNDGREEPLKEIQSNIASVFTFDSLGLSFNTCLFDNVTPVIKVALRSAFIGYLFGTLVLLLLIVLLMRLCGYGRGEEQQPRPSRAPPMPGSGDSERRGCWPTSIPVGSRFIGAFIALILYTYEYISENGFLLLKCVHIKSINEEVMFIDGNEYCYQDWQYVVMAFICVYVLPMFAVVSIAPVLLRERRIQTVAFVFSLIFPLLLLPIFIILYVRHRKDMMSHSVDDKKYKEHGTVQTVVHLIAEPYKLNELGGFCWEGVIILRRLVLVIIATLINSIITRHILLVFACLFALITHSRIKPFTKKSCNILESISLFIMLFIAVMNLVKGVYFDSGEVPLGVANTVLLVYDYIEVIFVSIIPSFILLFIVLCILIRLLALPVEFCQKVKRPDFTFQNGFRQLPGIPTHGENGHIRQAYGSNYNAYRQAGYNGYAWDNGQSSDPSKSGADQFWSHPKSRRTSEPWRNQGYRSQGQGYRGQGQYRRQSEFYNNSPYQRQQYDAYTNASCTTAWPRWSIPFYEQNYCRIRGSHWGSQQPYQHNPRRPSPGEWF